MSSDQLITISAAILAFSASVIATAVSIYNSRFQRFAQERWWERKVDAYGSIINALSGLVYYHEQYYYAELEHREIPDSRHDEISEFWNKGNIEVKRATAVGAFIISDKAKDVLQTYWKSMQDDMEDIHPQDRFSQIDVGYANAQTCLTDIVSAARKDLQID